MNEHARGSASPLLLVLSYLAFVSLGLPDAVLGLVWPSLRSEFSVAQSALGLPLAAGAVSYFVSGLLAGRAMQAFGVGALLALSTMFVAVGVFGYASAPAFAVYLAAACISGFGSGAVDAGLNTYAAENFGARHMAWLHAAYSTGAALGSGIATALFAAGFVWRTAYASIGSLLAALALGFVVTRARWSTPQRGSQPEPRGSAAAALRSPRVLLQAALFFVYSGVEVGAGQWSFTILTQGRALDGKTAALAVTGYWTVLLAGRILAGFVVERIGTVRLLRSAMLLAAAGALLFALPSVPALVSTAGLALVGLAIAPIFPGLMSETPGRVGSGFAAHAIGFQVSAATLGVALLPSLGGVLGEAFGLRAIAVFIAGCAALLFALHELTLRVAAEAG